MKKEVFKQIRALPLNNAMLVAKRKYPYIHPAIVVAAADAAKNASQFENILAGDDPLGKEVENIAWVYIARYCQVAKNTMPKVIRWNKRSIEEPKYRAKAIIDDGDIPVSLSCYSSVPVVVLANMAAAIENNPEIVRCAVRNEFK